jgi:hypothetical protein
VRSSLRAQSGSEDGRVTYGAYGEGERPAFLGSVSLGLADNWVEEMPSLWRYAGNFDSEVCNLIYNHGTGYGILRWSKEELQHQGDWHYTYIGFNSGIMPGERKPNCRDGVLYLYSDNDPAVVYSDIECALWGERRLACGVHHIVFEELSFRNSGVHGYQESRANHITIRDCEFRFIGGAVWSIDEKIRFGNAVEFWDGAEDIEVSGCIFDDIYDAGVTHQGSEISGTPKNVFFRNNHFNKCGLGAYECRGPAAEEVYFENNTCVDAGLGFSKQGSESPRTCESDASANNHILIWRIDPHTQTGHVYIRNNIFRNAPFGAVVYSVIDPADELHIIIDNNRYEQSHGKLLMHMSGRDYSTEEFEQYKTECWKDANSILGMEESQWNGF